MVRDNCACGTAVAAKRGVVAHGAALRKEAVAVRVGWRVVCAEEMCG